MSGSPESRFRWSAVILVAVLPSTLFSTGEGAILPIIPVVAHSLGASLAIAGLVSTMLLVGQVVGDIPSGQVIARIGERNAMIGASMLAALGLVTCYFAANPWVLGAGIFVIGLATAVFLLARHAFMTTFVPPRYRARALSTIGGSQRFGYLVGPFLTAGLLQLTHDPAASFWIQVVGCLAAAVCLIVLRDPEAELRAAGRETSGEREVEREARGLFGMLRSRRRTLLTVGVAVSTISGLRNGRQVVIPLWAVSIGLDETTTAVIIGTANVIDFLLFYLGGSIMDRFGRLWVALPVAFGLGAGFLLLSITHDLPGNEAWYIAVTMLLSVANGLGAGIMMTLGADLADPADPAPFLGAWRFTSDTGGAAAPLAISGVTAAFGLPIAVALLGVVGIVGGVLMRVFLPRAQALSPARSDPTGVSET
jgi:MFS family permease